MRLSYNLNYNDNGDVSNDSIMLLIFETEHPDSILDMAIVPLSESGIEHVLAIWEDRYGVPYLEDNDTCMGDAEWLLLDALNEIELRA